MLAVAGGAWTAAMGEWLGHELPVGPTKGQIVHLGVDAETGGWPIAQPLLTPLPRAVARRPGRVRRDLRAWRRASRSTRPRRACTSCCASASPSRPGLAGATYGETRVGLRPTSADDRALVGRVPGWSNAWVATGHGANGLLQGPYSARVLAHAMAGEPTARLTRRRCRTSFDPARFG